MVDSYDGSQGQQPDPDNKGSHDRHSASENNHDRQWATTVSSGSNGVSRAAYVAAIIKSIGAVLFKASHHMINS